LDLGFENCGLFCVQFSKWWTFTREFFKIWTSFLKNVDFSAYIFQNYGLLSVIFFNLDLDFENCGLLRATFEKIWTFTRQFFIIWTSFLKIVDFSAYIFQNYGLLQVDFLIFAPRFWQLWTFLRSFFKIMDFYARHFKNLDFYAWIFHNLDLVFRNYGLLSVIFFKFGPRFWKLWTFTRDILKIRTFTREFFIIWTSFLKIVDFSAYIFQNDGLLLGKFSKSGPHFWKMWTSLRTFLKIMDF
jgi:hypothetical protein